ncbi:MAG: molybdopterin-dependent oxidoreductase [Candidatus Marinimicrobia bacterium]|nr:molybdopterin-dependent oxidoreductase [Candidatus Neomarinimicrobiota bacterium]
MAEMKYIGKKTPRVDGYSLVTGQPVFADDVHLNDLLHIKILRSPYAHAKIVHIDVSEVLKMKGVVDVITHKDITPRYFTTAGQGYPEPSAYDTLILDSKVRYVGDRVAIVAAESVEIAEVALEKIVVKYEKLPSIFDIREAVDNPSILHKGEDKAGIADFNRNIAGHFDAEVGDVKKGFAESKQIFEKEYSLPYVQHCHIEPHVALTWIDENNRLVIRTATQVPFHVRRIISRILDFPMSRIRVIKPRVGGAFGGKQEILTEDVCAAVTLRTHRPSRLELTRAEEFHASRTRHPQIVKFKIGVNEDFTFNAIEMNILENSGAYGPHALTVMSVTASKSLGLYRSPNIRVNATAVYTNLPVAGAYRGYGAPQGFFPLESLVDEIANELGLDPVELRHINYVREGDDVPIAQILGEGREGFPVVIRSCGLHQCLEEGEKLIRWNDLRKGKKSGIFRRGVGVAIAAQGSGIAGIDMGSVFIKMNEDASFNLNLGATDIGTGSDTAMAQIAAEVLDVPVEKIIVYSSDTDLTPFDAGAYASSTTFISGGAVKKAAEEAKRQILERGKKLLKVDKAEIEDQYVVAADGKRISYQEVCTKTLYTEEQMQIMATASHTSFDSPPPYNATFADVTVDTETGFVTVNKIVSVTDIGQVINPQMAEGQVEGSIPQSLGYALSEFLVFDNKGSPLNLNFNDYHIYTAIDMPEIVTKFVHTHEPKGPFGAKAVAEIPINGPAPALANAIFNACGVRIRELPITPEKILNALPKD